MNKSDQDFSPYFSHWGAQLQREFASITWQYGLTLRAPAIEITDSGSHYGSWHAATRTIRISARLIVNHPWDVTCQILKHEMAHQLCDEYLRLPDETHGTFFQHACEMLGLPAAFRRASGDLPQEVEAVLAADPQTEQGRRFIEKIGKLLALAASANEHEAAIAMEKASELMARHNLRHDPQEEKSAFTTRIITLPGKRIETWHRQICAILMRFFFVRVVYASSYDPLSDTRSRTVELLGRQENVAIAEYCHSFLTRQIAALWQQNRGRISTKGLRARNSYYLGLLHGFHDKLQAQEQARKAATARPASGSDVADSKELAVLAAAEDKALGQFVDQRFPRLRKQSGSGARIYRDTFEQGRSDGEQIVLHHGINGQSSENGKQLAHHGKV